MDLVVLGPGRCGSSAFVSAMHDSGLAFSSGELTSFYYDIFQICRRGARGFNPEISIIADNQGAWDENFLNICRKLFQPSGSSEYSHYVHKLVGLPDSSMFNVHLESIDLAHRQLLIDEYSDFITFTSRDSIPCFFFRSPLDQVASSVARWHLAPSRAISLLDFQLQSYLCYSKKLDCKFVPSEQLVDDPRAVLQSILEGYSPPEASKTDDYCALLKRSRYAKTVIHKPVEICLDSCHIQYENEALSRLSDSCTCAGYASPVALEPVGFRKMLLDRLNHLGVHVYYKDRLKPEEDLFPGGNQTLLSPEQVYIEELEAKCRFAQAELQNLSAKVAKDEVLYANMQKWILELQARLGID
jgi:hypothetical protein